MPKPVWLWARTLLTSLQFCLKKSWSCVTLKQTSCNSTESCVGHCGTFRTASKCQCDSMCVYYGSCCADFDTTCPKKSQYCGTTSHITHRHVNVYCGKLNKDLVLSRPWRHFPGPRRRRNDNDPRCDFNSAPTGFDLTGQHHCSPSYNDSQHHQGAHTARWPCCWGLQRAPFWRFPAAEERLNIRIQR